MGGGMPFGGMGGPGGMPFGGMGGPGGMPFGGMGGPGGMPFGGMGGPGGMPFGGGMGGGSPGGKRTLIVMHSLTIILLLGGPDLNSLFQDPELITMMQVILT